MAQRKGCWTIGYQKWNAQAWKWPKSFLLPFHGYNQSCSYVKPNRYREGEFCVYPKSRRASDIGECESFHHSMLRSWVGVAGEEVGFQIVQLHRSLLGAGAGWWGIVTLRAARGGMCVNGTFTPSHRGCLPLWEGILGLFGSVEKPVSLGCLQAKWWALCGKGFPHTVEEKLLGFSIACFCLTFIHSRGHAGHRAGEAATFCDA